MFALLEVVQYLEGRKDTQNTDYCSKGLKR